MNTKLDGKLSNISGTVSHSPPGAFPAFSRDRAVMVTFKLHTGSDSGSDTEVSAEVGSDDGSEEKPTRSGRPDERQLISEHQDKQKCREGKDGVEGEAHARQGRELKKDGVRTSITNHHMHRHDHVHTAAKLNEIIQ